MNGMSMGGMSGMSGSRSRQPAKNTARNMPFGSGRILAMVIQRPDGTRTMQSMARMGGMKGMRGMERMSSGRAQSQGMMSMGRPMDRYDMADMTGMEARNAEPLEEWATRAWHEARYRASQEGDEFHRGPYPRDLAAGWDGAYYRDSDPLRRRELRADDPRNPPRMMRSRTMPRMSGMR